MTFRRSKTKVFVAAALAGLLAIPSAVLLLPQTARAQGIGVPVIDSLNLTQNVTTAVENVWKVLKEGGLDTLAWSVAKMALRQMTASIVGWVNNGFNGSPAFITDPGQYFLNVGDQAAGQYIFGTNSNPSPLSFLCNPISVGVTLQAALSLKYFNGYQLPLSTNGCSISQVIGNVENAQAFVSGDFGASVSGGNSAGWWNTWNSVTQDPDSNIYGAYLNSSAQLSLSVAGATALNQEVANWGQGFKSMVSNLGIETPGTAIKNQLDKALGSNQNALAVADELGEMIDSVAGALFNQMVTTGLASLSDTSSNSTARQYFSNLSGNSYTTGGSPFAIPSPQMQSETSNSYNQNAAEGVSAYNTVTQQSSQQAQQNVSTSNGIVTQTPQVNLSNAYAEQQQTYPGNGYTNYDASNALDGSSYDQSMSCPSNTVTTTWWRVQLPSPEYLGEIDIVTGQINGTPEPLMAPTGQQPPPPDVQLLDASGNPIGTPDSIAIKGGATDVRIFLSPPYSTTPAKWVKVEAESSCGKGGWGLALSKVTLYRHFLPVVNAQNVPATIDFATAQAGFDPTDASWVTGTYYPDPSSSPDLYYAGTGGTIPTPSYKNPQPLQQSDISVTVTDKNGAPQGSLPGGKYVLNPGTYTLSYTATDPDGLASAPATRTITVLPPPPPTVSISAAPSSIDTSQSATLRWSTTDATGCVASGDWSGTKPTSGSQSVSPGSVGTYTYTLECTGESGTAGGSGAATASGSAPLTVTAAP